MPKEIERFERVMYLAVAFGLTSDLLEVLKFLAYTDNLETALFVAIVGVHYGIMILLIWLTSRRRKSWPRWLLLIFYFGIVAVFITTHNIAPVRQNLLTQDALAWMQILLEAVALYFVFTRSSSNWFRGRIIAGRSEAVD